MQERDESRNEAGQAVDVRELAQMLEAQQQQIDRMWTRQRGLIRAVANGATLQAAEMERLLVD